MSHEASASKHELLWHFSPNNVETFWAVKNTVVMFPYVDNRISWQCMDRCQGQESLVHCLESAAWKFLRNFDLLKRASALIRCGYSYVFRKHLKQHLSKLAMVCSKCWPSSLNSTSVQWGVVNASRGNLSHAHCTSFTAAARATEKMNCGEQVMSVNL